MRAGRRGADMACAVLALAALVAAPRPAAAPATPSPADTAPAPCAASPLCNCAADHFACDNVPFHRFPDTEPGVRHVSVWGAWLGVLDEAALDARPLATLVLVACRLAALHPAALASMRSSLASLDLGHNEFTEVPLEALRVLNGLNWLNLQNNLIDELDVAVEWGALADSLGSLSLSNNRLATLAPGALASLRVLTTLELDGNRLQVIAPGSLPPSLIALRLDRNLLRAPPCTVLQAAGLVRLSLRDNHIGASSGTACHRFSDASSARLHALDLSHNELTDSYTLEYPSSLRPRQLLLDLNEFSTIPSFAVSGGQLERLSLTHNRVTVLPVGILRELRGSLRQLELDHNALEALPTSVRALARLRHLSIAYNRLARCGDLPPRLHSLSLAGNFLGSLPAGLTTLSPGSLAHLDLGYNRIAHVSAVLFGAWASTLRTLSLRGNRLASLGVGAFPALPLRELALSFNELYELAPGALAPLRALSLLELSGALAVGGLPGAADAASVTWLALDNNGIPRIDGADLLALPLLERLDLDFNRLVEFPSGTAPISGSSALREVRVAYNYVGRIDGEFLTALTELRSLDFSYNRMKNLTERTFSNVPKLAYIGLVGNSLESIALGTFRALPRLQLLELQENTLVELAADMFEDVASDVDNFCLNASHNRIASLVGGVPVPIAVLDLSNNLLESLPAAFVDSIATHVRRLIVAENRLVTLDSLGTRPLPRLAALVLARNELTGVRRRVFVGTSALQALDLSGNRLAMLVPDQFGALRRLRDLRLADNRLRALPVGALRDTLLERLDLARNRLAAPPTAALATVGFTLRHLELDGNTLRRLDAAALGGAGFLQELRLAHSALRVLPDAALAGLGRLAALDLSHNPLVANYRELLHPVPRLRRLALAGAGLRAVPALPLPELRELDLSGNLLGTLHETELRPLGRLRALNVSNNRLKVLHPAAWSALPRLASLDVSQNPLARLSDGAFTGLTRLLHLRLLKSCAPEALDPEALRPLTSLRVLEMDLRGMAAGAVLATVPHVEALTLLVLDETLDVQLERLDAAKLRELTLQGGALRRLSSRALAPLARSRALALRLRGSSVTTLPGALAAQLAGVPALALELRNNALTALGPAALYPNLTDWNRLATKMLPGGLVVSEGALWCGCGVAWAGAWLRRWTREVGGGERAALLAARASSCRESGAMRALVALESDDAACSASALSSRAAPAPRAALSALFTALLSLIS